MKYIANLCQLTATTCSCCCYLSCFLYNHMFSCLPLSQPPLPKAKRHLYTDGQTDTHSMQFIPIVGVAIAKRASDVIKFRPPARLRQTNRIMAEDFNLSSVSSSVKAIILTQNDGIPGCKFEAEPVNYTVEQLKCRGIKQTGKREDLLARLNYCRKSGNSHILDSCYR